MRTPRYSLRALLVLTTLLALALGWEAHEVRQRRQALELLKENGARVDVGSDLAGHWWSRFLFGKGTQSDYQLAFLHDFLDKNKNKTTQK